MSATKTYRVATFGLTAQEMRLLKSIALLSGSRARAYAFTTDPIADIHLFDADDPVAVAAWKDSQRLARVPFLAVSAMQSGSNKIIKRPIVPTRLLAALDELPIREVTGGPTEPAPATASPAPTVSGSLPPLSMARPDPPLTNPVAAPTPVAASRPQPVAEAPAAGDSQELDFTVSAQPAATSAAPAPRPSQPAPVAAPAPAAAPAVTVPHTTPVSKLKPQHKFLALVVDDSPTVRKQIELGLKPHDVGVHFAESAETALAYLATRTYDIAFLDVVLPGMDGYQVCKAIKRDKATRAIPVVMLTGRGSPFDKIKGSLAGCDTYLTKPVDPAVFGDVVRKYLATATPRNRPAQSGLPSAV